MPDAEPSSSPQHRPLPPRRSGPLDDRLASELVELGRAVAEEAAALILAGLTRDGARIDTKSSSVDLVTDMDRAAEVLIVGRLLDARPDDGVLGEEGAGVVGSSGVRWVIDPIDGTTNYVYGHPGFCVSVAAELDGTPAVGVVVDPMHRQTFVAAAGRGATRNGQPIRAGLGAGTTLATALVATGFSYDAARRSRQARVLTTVLPAIRDIRRMGSAAADLCSVACSRVDAYYEIGLNPWDFAAGHLIAVEAGAIVTDLDGGPPSGAFCLAAPPALHGPLRDLLLEAGAADA